MCEIKYKKMSIVWVTTRVTGLRHGYIMNYKRVTAIGYRNDINEVLMTKIYT